MKIVIAPDSFKESLTAMQAARSIGQGVLEAAKRHERYEKPSDRRRRELKAAIRKIQRQRAKQAAKERD